MELSLGKEEENIWDVRAELNRLWEAILKDPTHVFFSIAHDLHARPCQNPTVVKK